jgi:AraC-like DNA-binding protein
MRHRRSAAQASRAWGGAAVRIVAWTPQGHEQERALNTALGPAVPIAHCRSEQELWDQLEQPNVGVLILELGVDARPTAASLVIATRQRFPAIRIIGYGWLTRALAADILTCARLGLDELALRGYCDLALVVRRMLAEIEGAEEIAVHEVQDWLPSPLIALVRVLLARLRDAPTLAQLARAMGCSPRTLQRISARDNLCSPHALICAIRVLVAAHLISKRQVSMQEVLRRTGFPSTRALRGAMGRCGLLSPNEIHGAAGYAAARDTILRLISLKYREQTRALSRESVTLDAAHEPLMERPRLVRVASGDSHT